ncbi:MAG TPA: KTSC domain-containing protein [Mucilaginibacter sp.]|nr:KTSC domain-containing protein [Mucilaginibacter sp.]
MPSTVISKMEYNPETSTLAIDYVSGQRYLYKGVPETVYKELKASRVKGRYLRFFVKDKYAFEKVDGGSPEVGKSA